MTQYVTLDVIDRPAGRGALSALQALREVVRAPRPDGCLAIVPCGTATFNTRPWPKSTPWRIALIGVWQDPEAPGLAGALAAGAREHWHVRGELTRATGPDPWGEWRPDAGDARPLADGEPALVLISGELKARYFPRFMRDGAKAVAQAEAAPGYLGGLALASTPLNTTSCSAWRTAADSKAYAFKAGHHATAMKTDRSRGHHRTERFLRIRPLASHGTLRGRDPFAGVLGAAVAA